MRRPSTLFNCSQCILMAQLNCLALRIMMFLLCEKSPRFFRLVSFRLGSFSVCFKMNKMQLKNVRRLFFFRYFSIHSIAKMRFFRSVWLSLRHTVAFKMRLQFISVGRLVNARGGGCVGAMCVSNSSTRICVALFPCCVSRERSTHHKRN